MTFFHAFCAFFERPFRDFAKFKFMIIFFEIDVLFDWMVLWPLASYNTIPGGIWSQISYNILYLSDQHTFLILSNLCLAKIAPGV